ncbi:efflux RND transporter permease subunit [Aporhodopirellula aestuarii]|uniref:Efflux RND transporter permease subunit n=1 Tax=Aporhodopirellula aestuarii TaxID=2950107 RepID=A0ABT0U0S2_9BACT|nr:efflux RND transporter permease subunit [Aporhodopirellula aestuarii]MCM2370442.1 efflux RND transporter permease subunit [Aporhodopirellula aestuarii]
MLEKFVNHRTLANTLMLAFLGLGLYAIPGLQKETFPNFDSSEVQVSMTYLGASAEDVEKGICLPIEDALDGIQNIKKVTCTAQEGSASVVVEIEEGADVSAALNDIETEVEAISDFPAGAEDLIVTELNRTDSVMTITISGPLDEDSLKDYCEGLKQQLQRLPRVSLVEIQGFSDRQFRIELHDDALQRLGLSAEVVAQAVLSQNLDVPVGTIESDYEDLLLRVVEQKQTPQDIENIVIHGVTGRSEVRIGDIGRVVDSFADAEQMAWIDGERAGIIQINKTRSQDTTKIAEVVREFIEKEQQRQPKLRIAITNDGSELIMERLTLLAKNAWQGVVLVFLVMWLFFNLRLSFWVVMSLPVSFMGAFFVLPLIGQTLNMMSSVAILMATGILMDDGIVIAENIARHVSMGKDSMRAAVDGVKEVAGGVVSSFLTTCCVLGPLFMLEGHIGKVLRLIPMVLLTTLIVSLVEAFLILPAHLGHSLVHAGSAPSHGIRRKIDDGVDWVRESVFGRLIDLAIRWRYLTVGLTIATFIMSLAMVAGGLVNFLPFPNLEGDTVEARILMPQGTPLAKTIEVVRHINEAAARTNARFPDQPDGESLVQSVMSKFNENSDAGESGPHVATVSIRMLQPDERNTKTAEFIRAMREEVGSVPNAISVTIAEATMGPAGRAVEVPFKCDDLHMAQSAAVETQQWMQQFRGVHNFNVSLRPGKQENRLHLKPDAVALGLNVQAMASQLSTAFQGAKISDIQAGIDQYEINVQLAPSSRDTLESFLDFQFILSGGVRVPLQSVADLETTYGWSKISRVDGWRTVTLIADTDTNVVNTTNLMREFQAELMPKLVSKYNDLKITLGGEAERSSETGSSMAALFLMGLFGVYAILCFQFESWLEPLIVMAAIPMSLIGMIFGHMGMGMDICMPSLIGFVSLAGIVVNDSILLVLFLKQERAEGKPSHESARSASRLRFRAIMLTSMTTMVGLLPLTLEKSTQAQVLIPTAVSIVFGLFASTILVLIVVPCLYVVLCDLGWIQRDDHDITPASPGGDVSQEGS